jgi:hypothetical protein
MAQGRTKGWHKEGARGGTRKEQGVAQGRSKGWHKEGARGGTRKEQGMAQGKPQRKAQGHDLHTRVSYIPKCLLEQLTSRKI